MALLSRRTAVLLLAAAAGLAGCAGSGIRPAGEADPAGADSAAAEAERARRAAADRRVERGRALLERGEPRRAAAVLERALRIDATHGGAYLALARARLALGEADRARGLLDRAVELLRAEGSPAAERADSLRSALEEGG